MENLGCSMLIEDHRYFELGQLSVGLHPFPLLYYNIMVFSTHVCSLHERINDCVTNYFGDNSGDEDHLHGNRNAIYMLHWIAIMLPPLGLSFTPNQHNIAERQLLESDNFK